ncbi:N2227-domain-containing protein [Amylocystis lapponica]|nr:N2227-domain-containing protein [Amylocystis lapponica]
MSFSPSEIEEEKVHFANVVATFQQYAPYSLSANNRRRKDFYTLSRPDRELLEELGYKTKLADVDTAILANASFLRQIVANPEIFGHGINVDIPDVDVPELGPGGEQDSQRLDTVQVDAQSEQSQGHSHSHDSHSHSHSHATHSHSHAHPHSHSPDAQPVSSRRPSRKLYRPTDFEMDKLRSTLKQFVRDWSREGLPEREACYNPMTAALVEHFPDIPQEERGNFRVLVPGAGLGRLAWDVANLGFSCQGNEFSHYMLLSSFFILNRTDEIEKHTLYPYIHSFSNLPNNSAMLRPISIPDVLPSSLPPGADFSLVAGDFEEIYGAEDSENESHSGQWDAVLTCFFIDTAKNIVNYLRIIHRVLAPGGVWINLGPLLWHFENNSTNDPSVELSLEEVKQLARKIGFEISNERTIDTTYTSNAEGMLGYVYHAAFWTATKVV